MRLVVLQRYQQSASQSTLKWHTAASAAMQVSSRLAGRTTSRPHQLTRLQLPAESHGSRGEAAAASPRLGTAHETGATPRQGMQLPSSIQGNNAAAASLPVSHGAGLTPQQRLSQDDIAHGLGPSRWEATRSLAAPQLEHRAHGDDGRKGKEAVGKGLDVPQMSLGAHTPTLRPHGLGSSGVSSNHLSSILLMQPAHEPKLLDSWQP